MKTKALPTQFFQTLTELESHMDLVMSLAIRITAAVDEAGLKHPEKDSLQVHVYYLRESTKELRKARDRFNLMRQYFVPEIASPSA